MMISQSTRISSSGPAFKPTSDFRRRSTLRLSPRTNFQLSSDIASSGPPSNQSPTFIGDPSSGSTLGPTSNTRQISRPPALPSNQPPTFIGDPSSGSALRTNFQHSSDIASSGSAFEPTSDFHRRSIFRLSPRTNFQYSSDIASSGSAFKPISDFHRRSIFRLSPSDQLPTLIGYRILRPYLRTNLRLSSAIHLPAQPSDQLPTLIGYRILRPCLRTDLRLSSAIHPPAQPSDQLPTLIGYRILRPRLRTNLRLSSAIHLPARPSDQLPTLMRGHQLLWTVGALCLWMQVQILRFLWNSSQAESRSGRLSTSVVKGPQPASRPVR